MATTNGTAQTIIQGVLAAIAAAPQIEGVIAAGKTWVDALFTNGVISADVQNALKTYMDAHGAVVAAGNPPPEFTVEPDPPSVPSPSPAVPPNPA